MSRISASMCACSLGLALALHPTFAQESPAPLPAALNQEDLQTLRQAVEQQSKNIEKLTEQVADLSRRLEVKRPLPVPAAPATTAVAPPAASLSTPPVPAPATSAVPPSEAAKPEAAPAPDSTGKHTVAKGETLTSIAKRYNIPTDDLQKANKIEDDRKLQIGQNLTIPTPNNKAPEPPTEKKENP